MAKTFLKFDSNYINAMYAEGLFGRYEIKTYIDNSYTVTFLDGRSNPSEEDILSENTLSSVEAINSANEHFWKMLNKYS